MKIAIPAKEGMVDEHFGHCQYFAILTVDEDKNITAQEQFTPPPGCGCKSNLVTDLVEMGVNMLIAGNMGQGAVMKLQANGIQVIRGASGSIEDVMNAWTAGTLTDNNELCTAHGHDCSHH